MQIDDKEYLRRKEFLKFFLKHGKRHVKGLAESSAISVLEQFEKESSAKAKKGLEIAINDCLEDSSDWPVNTVNLFDQLMRENGAITLSELRFEKKGKFKSIINRGVIRNEIEYYFIKGIYLDGADYLAADEKTKIGEILENFEQRISSSVQKIRRKRET